MGLLIELDKIKSEYIKITQDLLYPDDDSYCKTDYVAALAYLKGMADLMGAIEVLAKKAEKERAEELARILKKEPFVVATNTEEVGKVE